MALVRSKSTDFFPHKTMSTNTRQLQEALYTHLDDMEKSAFIEALSAYGKHRDIFELVNALRKILNTPVKRQLFPLVRKAIRHGDTEAFDLLTRGDKHSTLPRPYLYRPHIADINVLNKLHKSSSPERRTSVSAFGNSARHSAANNRRASNHTAPALSYHRSETGGYSVAGTSGRDVKHKTLSKRSSNCRDELEGEIIQIDLGEPEDEEAGFGFTIRGGVEIGVGVYISSVDNGGTAQKEGLMTGDLILEANNISFRNITHDEAARIIKAATRLHLTLSRVGRIPSSHMVLEAYRWTDPKGRPVSPPPEGYGSGAGEDDGRSRSGSLMLTGSDERKVHIVVQRGHGLGLMIRGGKEYGLGIFISGIDPFSVAENAGLKLGDQILDVNGRSFLDVTHAEAVSHLKRGRHLIITVKDVGKIPFAKTTIDETGWIESTKVDSYAKSLTLSSRWSLSGSVTDQELERRGFSRGAGTQLMLNSPKAGNDRQRELIYDQARLLLNEKEQATLNYYLAEYDKKTIYIQGFVHALFEMLNTAAKMTLLSEIRTVVHPKDLDKFDQLVFNRDFHKSLSEARGMLAPDIISIGSYDSDDVTVIEKQKRTLFSQPRAIAQGTQWMNTISFDEEIARPPINYSLLEASHRLSRSTPDLSNLDTSRRSKLQLRSRARSRSKSPKTAARMLTLDPGVSEVKAMHGMTHQVAGEVHYVRAEVHPAKGKIDDPSDDSGVEINGHHVNGPQQDVSVDNTEYTSRYKSVRPKGQVPSKLSGPQQKILTHLQHRGSKDSIYNVHSQFSDSMSKHKSMSLPRPVRFSNNSTNEKRGSYNLVEHHALVHHSNNSGHDDIPNAFAVGTQHHSSSSSPHAKHQDRRYSSNTGADSRSRPRAVQDGSSRSRSKSNSRRSDTANRSSGFHGNNDAYHNARNHANMDYLAVPEDISSYEEHTDSSSTDRRAYDSSHKHHSSSSAAARPQARPRRERSPASRGGGESRRTSYNLNTSSSSTAVNSTRSQSTLTINGQYMSPVVSSSYEVLRQDVKKLTSAAPSSSLKQPQQQHQQQQPQHDQERRGRSRSRSPKPPRSAKVSKSRSPQQQRREIPPAQSLFTPDSHAHQSSSANQSLPRSDHQDNGPPISKETNSKKSKWAKLTSQRKNSSTESLSGNMGGANSSKYRSPRRESKQASKNIPLIRINSDTLPKAEAAALRQSLNGQIGNDVKEGRDHASANQSNDVYAVSQKTLDRVTISEHLVDIDTALQHNSSSNNNINNSDISNKHPENSSHQPLPVSSINI